MPEVQAGARGAMVNSGPRCRRLMRRYEKAGEPFAENPRCGRPAAHTGVCISVAALARQAQQRKARDRDAVLRKAHAHAAALRKAGKPVPLRLRRLDSQYRRRLEGRGDPVPLAPCGTYAAYCRHKDAGQLVDDDCQRAARAYWTGRKRARARVEAEAA